MLRVIRSAKSYLVGKYRAFNSSDNSFVVMMCCNRLIGIFDNPDSACDLLRLVKFVLIALVIIYIQVETGSMFFFGSFNLKQHFGILYMISIRQLSIIIWFSLAVHRHNLKQIWIYLLDLQRNTPDERRRKFIHMFNWITLIFLIQDMVPSVMWIINGQAGSPLSLYGNSLIDKFNAVLGPIAVIGMTLMYYYSIIVVCSLLPALTLEFRLLGQDFERIFEDVGSLEETARCAAKHWDKLEQTFVSCVERHQTLLNTAAAFRRQLKTYFLIQLGTNFLVIVLSTLIYVFTRRSEDSRFAFTAFSTIINIVNLLLYGYLCDQLEEEMAAINGHLYCSGWTDKLIYSRVFGRRYRKFRKMMLIVMERTQKKTGFTCGNLYEMSLITCRKVLWFVYSVLAVLLSFLE